MSAVSTLSTAQPPVLPVSQEVLGIANLGKSLADFLFQKNLLVQMVSSTNPLPEGNLLTPGIYVCLAGQSTADYQQYTQGNQLSWSGAALMHNNAPVTGITYFVIEVGYNKRFYANPIDSLSFGGEKPWAALYLLAQAEIPKINTAADATKTIADVQSHLADAQSLLNADPDYIEAEKEDIEQAVYTKINTAYQQRLHALGLDTAAADTAGGGQHPPQILRQVITDSVHTQALMEILRNARPEAATMAPAR